MAMPERNWRWLLVSGCPRSGTTMLNLLFNTHPQVRLTNENNFVRLVYRLRRLFYREAQIARIPTRRMGSRERWGRDDIQRATLVFDRCAAETLRTLYEVNFAAEINPGKARYFGDKLPTYYREDLKGLSDVLGPLTMIHISRNPVDVVESMLWRARNARLGLDLWQGPATGKEGCAEWIHAWNFVQRARRGALAGAVTLHHVKYEDFILEPQAAVANLAERLGLPQSFDTSLIVGSETTRRPDLRDLARRAVDGWMPGLFAAWDQPLEVIEQCFDSLKPIRVSTFPRLWRRLSRRLRGIIGC